MTRARAAYWGLIGLTLAVYGTMLVWSLPQLVAAAGGLVPFDLRPGGYDAAAARALIAALGDEGRAYYLNVQQGLDTAYPALMALSFGLTFRRIARGWLAWGLAGLSGVAAAFDYLENLSVRAMLLAGPDGVTDAMALVASRYTVLKSVTVAGVSVALVILLALAAVRRLKKRA